MPRRCRELRQSAHATARKSAAGMCSEPRRWHCMTRGRWVVPTQAARRVGGAPRLAQGLAPHAPLESAPSQPSSRVLVSSARTSPGRRDRCGHPRADPALRGRCLGPTKPWVRRPHAAGADARGLGLAAIAPPAPESRPPKASILRGGEALTPSGSQGCECEPPRRHLATRGETQRSAYTCVSPPRRSLRIYFRVTVR